MQYNYEITPHRRDLLLNLSQGHEPTLFHLFRFTRLPIPEGAIDAIFQDYFSRGVRGKEIFDELNFNFNFGIVNAAANILMRVKGDTYIKPIFARKPIY